MTYSMMRFAIYDTVKAKIHTGESSSTKEPSHKLLHGDSVRAWEGRWEGDGGTGQAGLRSRVKANRPEDRLMLIVLTSRLVAYASMETRRCWLGRWIR